MAEYGKNNVAFFQLEKVEGHPLHNLETSVVRVSPCVGRALLSGILDKLFNGEHKFSWQP